MGIVASPGLPEVLHCNCQPWAASSHALRSRKWHSTHTSLKATEFGGRRKCLGELLEKIPGALDSKGRTARAHGKGDVNEAYKECRFFVAGR